MRVLAFGDVHDEDAYYQDIQEKLVEFMPELVLSVGDIVNYKKLFECLEKGKTRFEFVFVHGNNDNLEEIRAILKGNPSRHYLSDKPIKIGLTTFSGIGGVLGVKERNFSEAGLKRRLESSIGADLLLTHLDPESAGGDIITGFVREHQPKYWIHGHKHEGAGRIKRMGKTIVINASKPVVMDLQL